MTEKEFSWLFRQPTLKELYIRAKNDLEFQLRWVEIKKKLLEHKSYD